MANALIFADGRQGVGLGHFSRCNALASEFGAASVDARVIDSADFSARLAPCDFVVIDSYILGLESYEKAAANARVAMFFDDTFRLDYPRGAVIINSSGEHAAYAARYPQNTLFVGAEYLLLRRAFKDKLSCQNQLLGVGFKNILLSFGASGDARMLELLATAVHAVFPAAKIHAICATPVASALTHFGLSESQMAELICTCDVAITAAGQSLAEILACGVSAVAVQMAENQRGNLAAFGACTLQLPHAFELPPKDLCARAVGLLASYDASLRLKHIKQARRILTQKNLWEQKLKTSF